MILSNKKPIIPMTNMATMILAFESFAPFWNSSQTKDPKPGLCANNSMAIKTIQATETVIRIPVKIKGMEEGKITDPRDPRKFTNIELTKEQPDLQNFEKTPNAVIVE